MTAARNRIGLVLGGGGVLGGAWMAGAMAAVADRIDRPIAEFDFIVGTSAGSLLAAQVRCGMTPGELLDAERRPEVLPGRSDLDRLLAGGAPFALYPGFGSPRMLLAAATAPHRVRPLAAATGMMPRGRCGLAPVAQMVSALVAAAPRRNRAIVDGWPAGEQTWIVATDYDRGRRAVFGQATSPRATLVDAVVASCSVPGWFAPARIGGRSYVDGGVCSTTSLDLLREAQLEHVYVLAPLASLLYDRPLSPLARVERLVRRWVTRQLIREVRLLRQAGTTMTLLLPGPQDLAAIGPNIMDPRRRACVAETSLRTSRAALATAATRDRPGG